tara:strand:- start:23775 stop:24089 length:315 start_codon:yes stop_codon:yes gene_type:complete
MNTNIKFATFLIPPSEVVKQSKTVGISMIVTIGNNSKSFTLVGQRAMPQLISSLERTTVQKPTSFTEIESSKVCKHLSEMEFGAIPAPQELSSAISKVILSKYI